MPMKPFSSLACRAAGVALVFTLVAGPLAWALSPEAKRLLEEIRQRDTGAVVDQHPSGSAIPSSVKPAARNEPASDPLLTAPPKVAVRPPPLSSAEKSGRPAAAKQAAPATGLRVVPPPATKSPPAKMAPADSSLGEKRGSSRSGAGQEGMSGPVPPAGSRSLAELSDAELIEFAQKNLWAHDKSRKHHPPPTPPSKPKSKEKAPEKVKVVPPPAPKPAQAPIKTSPPSSGKKK
jgi:hypothetical protein